MNILIVIAFISWSCQESVKTSKKPNKTNEAVLALKNELNGVGNTIRTRIQVPLDFTRSQEQANSFQEYLRNLKLKPVGSLVKYYNGNTKSNNNIYAAVVDMGIGTKDLHQCADAIMRLRAEYLWEEKKYEEIHFNFTNGHKVEYTEWMKGKRMNIEGNKTWWSEEAKPSNEYGDFWSYMELIFMYAGTASLEKELISKPINEASIGDVLIQGGHPGHAVIIIDKAINEVNGETIYLIAQSYMPAQEIQILINPSNTELSPWFKFDKEEIITPEWSFDYRNLKRFK